MEPFKKKYRPLRELLISSIIFFVFLLFCEYIISDIEVIITRKIMVNISFLSLYFFIYVLPTFIIFDNYNSYILERDKNYYEIEEKEVVKLVFVGTEDKIKDRPSVYSLPYHMNFFYIKIYIKSEEKPILVTSLDEYKVEEWAKNQFPNIEIEKKIDFFPTIRE